MRASLYRDGDLIAHVDTSEPGFNFNFDPSPRVYNFNVLVAMSS